MAIYLIQSIVVGGVGNFAFGGKVSYLEIGGKVQEARDAYNKIYSEGDNNPDVIKARDAFSKIYNEGEDDLDVIKARDYFGTIFNEQPKGAGWEERKNKAVKDLEKAKNDSRSSGWEERKNKALRDLEKVKGASRGSNWEERKNKAFEALEQAKKEEATPRPVVSETKKEPVTDIKPTEIKPEATPRPVVSETKKEPVVVVEPKQIKPEATANPVAKPTYNSIVGDARPVVSETKKEPATVIKPTEVKPEATARPVVKPSNPTAPILTKPDKFAGSTLEEQKKEIEKNSPLFGLGYDNLLQRDRLTKLNQDRFDENLAFDKKNEAARILKRENSIKYENLDIQERLLPKAGSILNRIDKKNNLEANPKDPRKISEKPLVEKPKILGVEDIQFENPNDFPKPNVGTNKEDSIALENVVSQIIPKSRKPYFDKNIELDQYYENIYSANQLLEWNKNYIESNRINYENRQAKKLNNTNYGPGIEDRKIQPNPFENLPQVDTYSFTSLYNSLQSKIIDYQNSEAEKQNKLNQTNYGPGIEDKKIQANPFKKTGPIKKYTPYSTGRPSIENDDLSPSSLIFSKNYIPASIDPKFDITKPTRVPFSDYNKPKTTNVMEERNKFLEAYNELRMFQNYEEKDSDIKSNEDKYIYPGMGDIYRSINEQNKKRQDRYSASLEKPTDDGYPETIYPPDISEFYSEETNNEEYNKYPKVFGELNKQIIDLKKGRRRVYADDRIAYLEQAKNKSTTQEEELRKSKILKKYLDFRIKIGKDEWTEDRDGKVITDTDLFLEKFNIQDAYNTLIRNRAIKNSPSFQNEPIMGMNEEKETQTLIEATAAILKENERLGIYVRSEIVSGPGGKAVEVKGGELRKRGYEKDDANIKAISIFGKQMKKDEEGRTGSKTGGLLQGEYARSAKIEANMWARSNNPKGVLPSSFEALPYATEEFGTPRSGELTQEAENKPIYYSSTPWAKNIDRTKPEGKNTKPVEVAKVAPKEPSKEEQEAKAKEQGVNQLRGLTQRDFSELNMSAKDYYVALTNRSPISEQDRNQLLANQATDLDFPTEIDPKTANLFIDRKKLSVLTGKSNPLRIFEKKLNNDINDNEKRRWERVQKKAGIYYSEYESLNRSLALVFDKAANVGFSEPLFAQTDNQAKQLVAFLQKDTARNTAGPTFFNEGGNVPSYRPNPNPSYFKAKGTDTVPAMLSPGEFVINASATAKHGNLLSAINSGKDVGYSSTGGLINYLAEGGTPEDIAGLQKKYFEVLGKEYKGNDEELILWNNSMFPKNKPIVESNIIETEDVSYPKNNPYFKTKNQEKATNNSPQKEIMAMLEHDQNVARYKRTVDNRPGINMGTPLASGTVSQLDVLKIRYPGKSDDEIRQMASKAKEYQQKSRKNPSLAMKMWDRYMQHMINYDNLNTKKSVTITDNIASKDAPIARIHGFAQQKLGKMYIKNTKKGIGALGHEMDHLNQDNTEQPMSEGPASVIANQKKYGIETRNPRDVMDGNETGAWMEDMKNDYYIKTGKIWNGHVKDLIAWGVKNNGDNGSDRFQTIIDTLKITHKKDPTSPSPESYLDFLDEVKNNVVKGGNTTKDVGYSANGGLIEYLATGDSPTSYQSRLKNAGITQKEMMEAIQSGDQQKIYEMNLKAGDAQNNSRNEIISKQFERQAQKDFNLFNEQGPDANKKAGKSRIGDLGNYAEGPQKLGSSARQNKPIKLRQIEEKKPEPQQKQTRTMPLAPLPPTQPPKEPDPTTSQSVDTDEDIKKKRAAEDEQRQKAKDLKDAKAALHAGGQPFVTNAQVRTKAEEIKRNRELDAQIAIWQAELEGIQNLSKGGSPRSSSDTIPAMLTPGEFVVNARQSSKNASLLHAINSGEDIQGFANGGPVGYYAGGKTRPSDRFNSAATKFGDEVSRLNAAISRMSIPSSGSNNTAQYIDIAKSSFEELSRILKTEIKIGSGPIDKFNNAVTQFGTNSTGFNSGFSSSLEKFKTYVDELNAAINRIPGTLNLEIMGTLNASLNVNFDTSSVYAAVTDATESLKGWITSEIDRQITDEMG